MKLFFYLNKAIHLGWFTIGWWKYLFGKPKDKTYTNWFNRIWCRATGHRDVWYYNPNGFEPDMTCKNCGDYCG
jgi:hypothetical protein